MLTGTVLFGIACATWMLLHQIHLGWATWIFTSFCCSAIGVSCWGEEGFWIGLFGGSVVIALFIGFGLAFCFVTYLIWFNLDANI